MVLALGLGLGSPLMGKDQSLESRLRIQASAWAADADPGIVEARLNEKTDRDLLEFLTALWAITWDPSLSDNAHRWAGAVVANVFNGPHDHQLGGSPLDAYFGISKSDYDRIADGFFIDKYFSSPRNSKQWCATVIMLRQRHTGWADEFIKREKLPGISEVDEILKKLRE